MAHRTEICPTCFENHGGACAYEDCPIRYTGGASSAPPDLPEQKPTQETVSMGKAAADYASPNRGRKSNSGGQIGTNESVRVEDAE